ncbi:MAG: hypothetical protein JXB35_15975 [Anaerolineae bacterium]|nr:hypothetical protein [Anaerolineae bacterium]
MTWKFSRVAIPLLVTAFAWGALLIATGGNGLSATPGNDVPTAQAAALAEESWTSGWFAIAPGATRVLTHNLGGDVAGYAVELWFRDTDAGGLGVNAFGYGGFEYLGQWEGGYWSNLTASAITVHRMADDAAADHMRVRIWFMTPPDYDSGWQAIVAGAPLTVTHALGGAAEDYTLGLWFQDDAPGGLGVHHRYFGSVEHGGQVEGAHWQNLDDQNIRVARWADDAAVDRVRLHILETPPAPAYDSGWQDIAAGATLTLTHNVGGPVGTYRVALHYRDASGLPGSFGQNMLWAGGEAVGASHFGGHWQRLTDTTIEVYRQPDGARPTEVRVRIWTPTLVYLPLVSSE